MPFLDTLGTPQADGSLLTTVYRKSTHTNQYLQWDSHHTISAKYSVISTLFHRAKEVYSTKQQLDEENEQLQKVLTTCKYPRWSLNRMKKKINVPVLSKSNKNKEKNGTDNRSKSSIRRNYITVANTKGLSESFKNICKKHGIQVYFRGAKPSDHLVAPKDKDHITKNSGIIYRYKCDRLECDEEYIGESARTFGERFREHLKAPSQFMTTVTSQVIPLHWIISV